MMQVVQNPMLLLPHVRLIAAYFVQSGGIDADCKLPKGTLYCF